MKEKEIYLADLRSLKENISNKIMEAIQDLEAKNLKKIEKKIEKASQKIAMGLIKASLKNAELLTRKITNAISPLNTHKNSGNPTLKKRGRPSLNKGNENLMGLESSTIKTLVAGNPLTKRRGRPSKSKTADSNVKLNTQSNPLSTAPKKRGRPFGAQPKTVLVSNISRAVLPGSKRGRPKLIKSGVESSTSETNPLPLKKRGRPRLNNIENSGSSQSPKLLSVKGRRGRPTKIQKDNPLPESNSLVEDIKSAKTEQKNTKKENSSISALTIPKTRGRKPKNQENSISKNETDESVKENDKENS